MRTKCSKGHKYTDENTYRRVDGKRGCNACRQLALRPRVDTGDEVSVYYKGRNAPHDYHDTAYIKFVSPGEVLISFSAPGEEKYYGDSIPYGPFSLITGKSIEDPRCVEWTVIFDDGYAAQHFEDLSLGEGDTL